MTKTYTVTLQDLRPGMQLRRYERTFTANTRKGALRQAEAVLRAKPDRWDKGVDYQFVGTTETIVA